MNDLGERSKPTGFTRLFRAMGASMKGFAGAYREEAAFRQELALAVAVIPLGLWLGKNGIERVLLIAPMFIVLIVELLNTAVEKLCDHLSPALSNQIKVVKDLGSAAVFVALVLAASVWLLALWRLF